MLELLLVRHGATRWNGEGRLVGQTDVELGEMGREQAQRLKVRFKEHRFDAVYSSDLSRARETARVVFGREEIRLDGRLREMDYGSLQGKVRSKFSDLERQAYLSCRDNVRCVPAPGGESWCDLEARVTAWLKSLPSEGRVVAFTHGTTIRCAVFTLTAASDARNWSVRLGNTSVTWLALHEERAVLEVFNDTTHLDGIHG